MSKVALFFKKMHKVFKNKAQGCSRLVLEVMPGTGALAGQLATVTMEIAMQMLVVQTFITHLRTVVLVIQDETTLSARLVAHPFM